MLLLFWASGWGVRSCLNLVTMLRHMKAPQLFPIVLQNKHLARRQAATLWCMIVDPTICVFLIFTKINHYFLDSFWFLIMTQLICDITSSQWSVSLTPNCFLLIATLTQLIFPNWQLPYFAEMTMGDGKALLCLSGMSIWCLFQILSYVCGI